MALSAYVAQSAHVALSADGALSAPPTGANHWHFTECHRLRVARGCFTPRIPPTSVGKKRVGWAGVRLATVESDAILGVVLCRCVYLPSHTLFEAPKTRTACGF